MGWSWAVASVQSSPERLSRDVGRVLGWVEDKVPNSPLADVGAVKLRCTDNFAVIADSADVAEGLAGEMEEVLAAHGVRAARDLDAKGDGVLLGFQLDPSGERRPTMKRYWKIADALDRTLDSGHRGGGRASAWARGVVLRAASRAAFGPQPRLRRQPFVLRETTADLARHAARVGV